MIQNLLNEWKLKNAGEDMTGKLAAIDNPQSTTALWRNAVEEHEGRRGNELDNSTDICACTVKYKKT